MDKTKILAVLLVISIGSVLFASHTENNTKKLNDHERRLVKF